MDLVTGFGFVGVLLLLTALAAGLVARAPVSFPMIFLALGLALGPGALGVLRVGPDDRLLELVAVLTLSLILFMDGMDLEMAGERRDLLAPVLALGPGTLIVIGLVGLAAVAVLCLPPQTAFLLGALLASTDPVVLKDVLRDDRIPGAVRRILRLESGANDAVVLPVVLVLIAVTTHRAGDAVVGRLPGQAAAPRAGVRVRDRRRRGVADVPRGRPLRHRSRAPVALWARLVIRPFAVTVVLAWRTVRLSWPARAFIAWFGPRERIGTSSDLFRQAHLTDSASGFLLDDNGNPELHSDGLLPVAGGSDQAAGDQRYGTDRCLQVH